GLACGAAQGQIYDLLIKNGQVLDAANGRNGRMDVAIVGGKIVKVAKDLPSSRARTVVEASEYYVTPGLIDMHVHFDAQGAWLNLNPDHNALRFGVTTAVDAGSSGADNFEAFRKRVIDEADTRVLAFLNIVGAGMYGGEVENDPRQMNVAKAVAMVKKHRDVIVGIKTAHYQPADWTAVDNAVKAASESGTVTLVDFHPKPGRGYAELLAKHMRPGDIHTHFYGRLTPQLDANGKVQPYMLEARRRGVLFDVGHGSGSFWFRIAAPMIAQGFVPDTISTDLHKDSVMLPGATMPNVMSKLMNLGMTVEQVVERSTARPAKAIGRKDLGTLSEGSVADVALFKLERGTFAFLDSGHGKLTGDKRLRCAMTVREGKIVWDEDGLSTADVSKAGPYSNFK
ncbi:MAG: amidohydrolase/deacetylase family metallohydrolase, partial [Bryobacterales bacterium]|nr:amidohydrolase/deacetylase family metallohydrolase [Bryobacterales bacterium]